MSESAVSTETSDAPVDRKALLEQQFEAAEQVAEEAAEQPRTESRQRDDSGKFTTKPARTEKAAPEASNEVDPPVWKRPPASWKKEVHELWNTADDRLKEYAWQREEQMRKGVEPLLTKAQFADSMNQALEPYMNTIRGLGLTPDKAVSAIMQADNILRTAPPQQKLAYLQQLAQQYGIDMTGAVDPNAVQQQNPSYQFMPILNEINNLKGELNGWKQQQEAVQNQALLGEINAFAQKAEHFEEARETMIPLLQNGLAQTLEDAYEKAIRLNPEIFERVQQAQQVQAATQKSAELNRAAKAARAAAVSVRSSTPGTNTAPKAQDRRTLLAEQFDAMSERL
jgi:hypothetical protein